MIEPGADPLLVDLAAGHTDAFRELYDRFGTRLYRAAWGMLGQAEDAEDAVQEVFAAVARSRRRLAKVDDLTAYLFAALRRAAGRLAERRARQPATSEVAVRQAPERCNRPENSYPHSERLEQALQSLPAEQREVIAMKIDGQLTFAQIAQIMKTNTNTAASRYRYALEKLRASLEHLS
jgi:RNA polymerase sigma-70 factor (ECF subfamily)